MDKAGAPALSGADDPSGDPWAVLMLRMLLLAEMVIVCGGCSWLLCWGRPGAEGDAPLADAPDVWSDGSLVLDGCSGIGVAGCGVYARASGAAWFGRMWGHLDLLPPLPDGAGELALCRLCSGLRFGEFWLPCKAVFGCMLVWITLMWLIMSLVLLMVGVLASLSLVTDGDLLLRVQQLVCWRGIANAAVSKVKGHADEGLGSLGQSFVRSTVLVIMKRMLPLLWVGCVCTILLLWLPGARWYPVVRELHRFFIAIARSVLNDDGMSGTTLHPVVWSAAANPKRRKVEQGRW